MDAIKLAVWVGEDKKLIIDLPADTPVGLVDVQISRRETEILESSTAHGEPSETWAEKREHLRKQLIAAGLLSTAHYAPEGTIALSAEDLLQLGTLPPGTRPTDELIDEDRGAH